MVMERKVGSAPGLLMTLSNHNSSFAWSALSARHHVEPFCRQCCSIFRRS